MQLYQVISDDNLWEVYRFPYEPVDSNMFFIPDGQDGIVFDPNENEEQLSIFEKKDTKRITIVLTHEHYDHTSGVLWLQSKMDNKLFCHVDCAKTIAQECGNDPKLVAFVLSALNSTDGEHRYMQFSSQLSRNIRFKQINLLSENVN